MVVLVEIRGRYQPIVVLPAANQSIPPGKLVKLIRQLPTGFELIFNLVGSFYRCAQSFYQCLKCVLHSLGLRLVWVGKGYNLKPFKS